MWETETEANKERERDANRKFKLWYKRRTNNLQKIIIRGKGVATELHKL